VLVIVLGMILVLGLTCWVLWQVAYAPLHEGGEELLTQRGEELTADARRGARKAARVARKAQAAAAARVGPRGTDSAPDDAGPDAGSDEGAATAGATADPLAAAEEPYDGPVRPDVVAGVDARRRPEETRRPEDLVPPRQHGSPVATPAGGVSGTISR